jgi:integrase
MDAGVVSRMSAEIEYLKPEGHLLDITPDGAETQLKLEWRVIREKGSWYARWLLPVSARKNPAAPYKWKALETTDLEEAKPRALSWWRQISEVAATGQALDIPTFKKAAEKYLADFKHDTTIMDNGRPRQSKAEYIRYKSSVMRYLIPYFGSYRVTQIPHARLDAYEQWRKDYYISGPGAAEEKIPYMRNGKRMSRPSVKYSTPTHSTLNKDVVAFNNIMTYVRRRMGVQFHERPKIELRRRKNVRPNQRAYFDDDELQLLMKGLGDRCQVKNSATQRARKMLYYFCSMMLYSGLRTAEAYRLRVGDITERSYADTPLIEADHAERLREVNEGRYFHLTKRERSKLGVNKKRIQELEELNESFNQGIEQTLAENPELKEQFDEVFSRPKTYLRVRIPVTKDEKHTRFMIPDPEFKMFFVLLKLLLLTSVDKEALQGAQTIDDLPRDLPLFCHADGKSFARVDHSFDAALKEIKSPRYPNGLEFDLDGKKRALTSFRHCYATRKLREGIDIKSVADQIGTDLKMIEKHYDHVLKEMRAVAFL